jgi:hypothetical protein
VRLNVGIVRYICRWQACGVILALGYHPIGVAASDDAAGIFGSLVAISL